MSTAHAVKIGELAKLSGLSRDTIRYYESCDLISPSQRSDAGYRLYDGESLGRLAFISNAKALGFSLKDIGELLSINIDKGQYSCQNVKDLTQAKLQQVEAKMAELQRIQQALQSLHQTCCGGPESAESCSILQQLNQQAQQ